MITATQFGLFFNKMEYVKMKKAVILILIFINLLNLSGCLTNKWGSTEYDMKWEAEHTEEELKKILECFDNMDTDTLISMFSEAVKAKYDLSVQINQALEIYGNKSVSYEKCEYYGYITMSTDYGKCTERSIYAKMHNIKTDCNEIFNISIIESVIDNKNPNELGIYKISLSDPEYGNLAIIGPVDDQDLKILKENNQKRNGNKSSENSDAD